VTLIFTAHQVPTPAAADAALIGASGAARHHVRANNEGDDAQYFALSARDGALFCRFFLQHFESALAGDTVEKTHISIINRKYFNNSRVGCFYTSGSISPKQYLKPLERLIIKIYWHNSCSG
jgi:hypothetical protein